MSARFVNLAAMTALAVTLAACGERPQELGAMSSAKKDAAAYTGGESSRFASEGYKSGDRNAWALHLRARAQNTQSDYQRVAN